MCIFNSFIVKLYLSPFTIIIITTIIINNNRDTILLF